MFHIRTFNNKINRLREKDAFRLITEAAEVFFKKNGVLRNFAKSTGKHLCQSLYFNKIAGRRPDACEFCEISKNPFFKEQRPYNGLTFKANFPPYPRTSLLTQPAQDIFKTS